MVLFSSKRNGCYLARVRRAPARNDKALPVRGRAARLAVLLGRAGLAGAVGRLERALFLGLPWSAAACFLGMYSSLGLRKARVRGKSSGNTGSRLGLRR